MHLKYVQNPHSVTLIFLTRKKRGNNQYLPPPTHNCRIINYKNKNSGFICMITCDITEKYFEITSFC
ncbi:hypothetical protein C9216_25800 (plasmid) [Escherichia coli]|nr:hypothetical protein [Escherichia coli]EFI9323353.1 hypothetical protein [Escherichia coli]OTB91513.1 hypothetical protein AW066_25610 [Escherichia coli]OTE43752.1 hypothetical protein AW115_26325 [Escherichia coli]PSY86522.1 hypothetical protein C7B02_28065 [Escherichia coli]